jgi:osmotically-inducible protein OsmY
MAQTSPLEILDQVQAALQKETRYGVNRYPVQLALHEGTLILAGEFPDIRAKRHAVHVVQMAAEGLGILDQLNVTSAIHEEGTLRSEVTRALSTEPVFSEMTLRLLNDGETEVLRDRGGESCIDIRVVGGTVRLSGYVGSLSHRRLAEVLCWWSLGCERVDNLLEVVPGEMDNDDEVSDALRLAMEKDPLVHAEQISIQVHNGSVILQGYVPSQEERHLAELDAWYIPGVYEVVNDVQAQA